MKQKTLDNQTAELLDKIGKQKMEELQFQQLKTVQLQILIEQKERLIMESNKNAQKKLLKLYKEKISRQNEDEIINKKDIEATKEDTVRISPDEFEKLFADNLSKKLNFETFETSFAFGNVYLKIKDDPKVYYITQAEFTALKKKNNSIPWEKEYDKIFTKVEIESQFPGGENPWKRYLDNNIKNPIDASGKKMQGLVELQFIIDKEGNIIHYRVIGGNSVLQEEAIRLLTKSGQWTPAVQNGHKVKAYKKQVIVFGDVTKEEIEKANESTTATINN